MAKAKTLANKASKSNQSTITQIVHKPLTLTPCTTGEGKFETIIQGKTITAYFAKKPDDNALKLVKQILIDSHTSKNISPMRTPTVT